MGFLILKIAATIIGFALLFAVIVETNYVIVKRRVARKIRFMATQEKEEDLKLFLEKIADAVQNI